MPGLLQIFRGAVCIADGVIAKVIARPVAEGSHLADLEMLARASEAFVVDRDTKSTRVRFTVLRSHDSEAAAFDHSMRAGQAASGVADLVITFDDGTDVHAWTLADAWWNPIAGDGASVGVGSRISYEITGGIFAYDGSLPSGSEDGGGVDPDYLLDGGAPDAAPEETLDAGTP